MDTDLQVHPGSPSTVHAHPHRDRLRSHWAVLLDAAGGMVSTPGPVVDAAQRLACPDGAALVQHLMVNQLARLFPAGPPWALMVAPVRQEAGKLGVQILAATIEAHRVLAPGWPPVFPVGAWDRRAMGKLPVADHRPGTVIAQEVTGMPLEHVIAWAASVQVIVQRTAREHESDLDRRKDLQQLSELFRGRRRTA
jgi:hypothetical protein